MAEQPNDQQMKPILYIVDSMKLAGEAQQIDQCACNAVRHGAIARMHINIYI